MNVNCENGNLSNASLTHIERNIIWSRDEIGEVKTVARKTKPHLNGENQNVLLKKVLQFIDPGIRPNNTYLLIPLLCQFSRI